MAAKLTIKTNGQTLITALYKQDGSTGVTVYTDQNLSSSTTVGTITADTTYWVATDDHYVLSVTQPDGSQIANSAGATAKLYLAAGSPVEVSPMPTAQQVAADVASGIRASATGRYMKTTRASSNVSLSGATYAAVDTALDLTVNAVAGQVVLLGCSLVWNNDAPAGDLEVQTLVSGSPVNTVSGIAIGTTSRGISGWCAPAASTYTGISGTVPYVVQSGDLSAGTVTFRLYGHAFGGGTKVILSSSLLPVIFWAWNVG